MLFPLHARGSVWDAVEKVAYPHLHGGGGGGGGPQTPRRWPFPERALLKVLAGTAAGLRAMHRAGYAHRDVKPHNVLLTDAGAPVLMDLGSAAPVRVEVRSHREAMNLKDEASVKCSAPYRAPELMEVPYPGVVDGQSDVWSLGCTAFAMAFGLGPFENATEGVLTLGILNARYRFPDARTNVHTGERFSQGFCDLVAAMLAREPKERPTVDQLVKKLEKAAKGR